MDNDKIISILESLGRRLAVENLSYAIYEPKGYKYTMKAYEHAIEIIKAYIKQLKNGKEEKEKENGKN